MEIKFGERMQLIRQRRKMTQTQLAKATRLNQSTIHRIEHGENKPSMNHLIKIAEALEVSLDYLVGRD